MIKQRENYGIDLQREILEMSEEDWVFGSGTDLVDLAPIPKSEREKYLPDGEVQRSDEDDTMDCASRAPVNKLETKFTYFFSHGMAPENKAWCIEKGYCDKEGRFKFSDAFIAITSRTTKKGNSLKAPIEAVRVNGLLPKFMLPLEKTMTFEQYHDPSRITPQMYALAIEFKRRFSINYERVLEADYAKLIEKDILIVAGHAWDEPINNVYPRSTGRINHAFIIFGEPKYKAFDNYIDDDGSDFKKQLAEDYDFLEYGYRTVISNQNVNPPEIDVTKDIFNNIYEMIKDLLKKIANQKRTTEEKKIEIIKKTMDQLEVIKNNNMPPIPQTPKKTLLEIAKLNMGKDVTPKDNVPDEVACAEVVSTLIQKVIPEFKIIPSTLDLLNEFRKNKNFKQTEELQPGSIIINATGTGNGSMRGHVGIIMENNNIASNNSFTGVFHQNYIVKSWVDRFKKKGGMPTRVFKIVSESDKIVSSSLSSNDIDMNSELFKLDYKDLAKGLVVSVIVAVLEVLRNTLTTNGLDLSAFDWKSILEVAITAGVAYLGKNFFSTSDGKVLGKIG